MAKKLGGELLKGVAGDVITVCDSSGLSKYKYFISKESFGRVQTDSFSDRWRAFRELWRAA